MAIKSASDAQAVVDGSKVGDALTAKIIRQQKTIYLAVTAGDLNDRPMPARG